MKKKDILTAVIILIIAAVIWLISYLTASDAASLRITVNGDLYGTYTLDKDQEIPINDTNICRIHDGHVTMIEADCPDQICVHTAAISKDGGSIVCLPNRIVLEIISEDGEKTQPELDSISS